MRVFALLKSQAQQQRGQFILWMPVLFGAGIFAYFELRFEPDLWGLACLAVFSGLLCLRWPNVFVLSATLFLGGLSFAAGQAHLRAGPVLDHRYYGAITGRVVKIDRSASDAVRLTLDQVRLRGFRYDQTPKHIRISMLGDEGWLVPRPYQVIGTTGYLAPPSGPTEPGGFDFQRHAYFLQIGAIGYTRRPVLELAEPEGRSWLGLRHHISNEMANYLGGDIGGFAAAVSTGDRRHMPKATIQALRISNLAHLLAISGLHIGLLAGFVFASLRLFLITAPFSRNRLPAKKIAAIGAIFCAAIYLALAGGGISTQRAFVMATVVLGAVVLDRQAISLRSVAIAAMCIMLLDPSSVLSVGFHMSFAATIALVAVFVECKDLLKHVKFKWVKAVLGVVISSSVAGVATAPFAAASFNQFAAYGLIANLLAVPAMGLIVIPALVLAAVLTPFGLHWVGLELAAFGLGWIIWVAQTVASWPDARLSVISPDPIVLPMLVLGALFFVIWKGPIRCLGVAPIVFAIWAWVQTERPDVLISAKAELVGVMTPQGRALSKGKSYAFIATRWLERDGDNVSQALASLRLPQNGRVFSAPFKDGVVWHVSGKRAAAEFLGCRKGDILITNQSFEVKPECRVINLEFLQKTGGIAIYSDETGLRIKTVAKDRGQRLWTLPKRDQ